MLRHGFAFLIVVALTTSAFAENEKLFEERLKDFGPVQRGPTLTHYYRFTNTTKQTLTISSVRVSCGCVTAFAPVAKIAPGESSYIGANMDSRRFTGHKSVDIYVDFIEPVREVVTLTIMANGRDDFSMTPGAIDFGQIRKGNSPKASVQVTLTTDANWTVNEVTAESNFVLPKATLLKRQGAEVTYEISATLRPELPPGKWFTDVWVKTSNPTLAKIRVPLTVDVTTAVSINPGNVEFTDVKVGETVEKNVMVRGEKPFKISEIRGLDESIKVEGVNKEPRAVHLLKVVYKPTKVGKFSRSLGVMIEGEKEAITEIPVKANAVDPLATTSR